jgi:hypothetical protein
MKDDDYDEHIACFSWPNCDELPTGCLKWARSTGYEVEEFGHKEVRNGTEETS